MSPKRRRRARGSSDSSEERSQHGWEADTPARRARLEAKSEAADGLKDQLLLLYASAVLDAKSVCVLAYYATEAGVDSEDIKQYAVRPGLQTGKYAAHLKKHLPMQESAPELNAVKIPIFQNGRRSQKGSLAAPIHEVLEAEADNIEKDGMQLDQPDENDWTSVFHTHPHRH